MAGADDNLMVGPLDSIYVRCWEECLYARDLSQTIQLLRAHPDRISQQTFMDRTLTIKGKFSEFYMFNRRFWGKDLWDEARIRDSWRVFWGWNMVEFHELARRDRNRLYLQLNEFWVQSMWTPLVLGVPTPWVYIHAQGVMFSDDRADEALQSELDNKARVEYTIFTVCAVLQAAAEGIYRQQNDGPDYRLTTRGDEGEFGGRLFNFPPGVIAILSQYHPFYIIESLGLDPIDSFVAIRRAQEIIIDDGPCIRYNFRTTDARPILQQTYVDDVGERFVLDEIKCRNATFAMTSKKDAAEAWALFQDLTKDHKGRRARVQPWGEVTKIMNGQEYGIESVALTEYRNSITRAQDQWTPTTRQRDAAYEAESLRFKEIVDQLEPEADDGGASTLSRQRHIHPVQRPVPGDETTGGRPDWWPADETIQDTKARLDVVAVICGRNSLEPPTTIGGALNSVVQLGEQLTDLTDRLKDVTDSRAAIESQQARLTGEVQTANERIEELNTQRQTAVADLEASEQRVAHLRGQGEVATQLEATVAELRRSVAEKEQMLIDERASALDNLRSLRQEIAQHTSIIDQLRGGIVNAQRRNVELQSTMQNSDVSTIMDTVQRVRDMADELRVSHRNAMNKVQEELDAEREKFQTHVDGEVHQRVQKQLEDAVAERDAAVRQRQVAERRAADAEISVTTLQQSVSHATAATDRVTAEMGTMYNHWVSLIQRGQSGQALPACPQLQQESTVLRAAQSGRDIAGAATNGIGGTTGTGGDGTSGAGRGATGGSATGRQVPGSSTTPAGGTSTTGTGLRGRGGHSRGRGGRGTRGGRRPSADGGGSSDGSIAERTRKRQRNR